MIHVPKYPRTMHSPFSPGLQNDDRVSEFPLDILSREVIITEKMDGCNTAIFDGQVYARSTGQPSAARWFAMVRKHHAWKTIGDQNFVYYGEDIYGVHSCVYDAVPEAETFMLFAVRQLENGVPAGWLSWEMVKMIAEEKGMKTVPVLFQGTFSTEKDLQNWFETEIRKPSAIGGDREGFVVRCIDEIFEADFPRLVQKYVRANHVQTDKHWKMNWQTCEIVDRK